MKRVVLILLAIIFIQTPGYTLNKKMVPETGVENSLPNIFIYTIPDDTDNNEENKKDKEDVHYIDNTTSTEENEEEAITLTPEDLEDNNITIGATVLKGYAEYIEDSSAVYLKDDDNNFVLNIKVPQKITGSEGLKLTDKSSLKQADKYTNSEYKIKPKNIRSSAKTGNFTFGALYNDEVDNIAMLESETGLFTKYEREKFALSSSVKKSLNTTYAQDYNTISITPELKLNSYMSLKNTLSADITRNRRSSELIFSLNPFGKKDSDRMLLEAGAKQTYYADTGENKTQLNFSAKFKL